MPIPLASAPVTTETSIGISCAFSSVRFAVTMTAGISLGYSSARALQGYRLSLRARLDMRRSLGSTMEAPARLELRRRNDTMTTLTDCDALVSTGKTLGAVPCHVTFGRD